MTKKDFYYCYDKKMRNYLVDNGHRYICTALSISSNDQFWLFYQNVELNKTLKNYNSNHPEKRVEKNEYIDSKISNHLEKSEPIYSKISN